MWPKQMKRLAMDGNQMQKTWVVYTPYVKGETGANAVCTQAEWDALKQSQPGRQTLIKSGIVSEGEAEQFARPPVPQKSPRAKPNQPGS
jgi:hypothetical protein